MQTPEGLTEIYTGKHATLAHPPLSALSLVPTVTPAAVSQTAKGKLSQFLQPNVMSTWH